MAGIQQNPATSGKEGREREGEREDLLLGAFGDDEPLVTIRGVHGSLPAGTDSLRASLSVLASALILKESERERGTPGSESDGDGGERDVVWACPLPNSGGEIGRTGPTGGPGPLSLTVNSVQSDLATRVSQLGMEPNELAR